MAGGRIRAFRTLGTTANLRASLAEFASAGGGMAATVAPGAHIRVAALGTEFESVQASGFDRIVARCLTIAGESMLPIADEIQEREVLARVARDLDECSPYFASREFAGFVRRLAATLRELRAARLSADAMREMSTRAEPWLAAKLESLAILDEGLRAGLKRAAREVESDRMERCLSARLPDGLKARLWLYTGGEFSNLASDWVGWAAKQGIEVWLLVDGQAKATRHCLGAERTLETVGVEATFLGGANALAEGLFADQPTLDPGLRVRILSAGDPLSECEWALRAMAEEVQAGMNWEQGAIFARNLDDYAPLLHATAERFGIALRLPRRERLAHNGWVRFLSDYLAAAASDSPFALRKQLLRSYLGLDPESAERQRSILSLAAAADDPWLSLRERLDPALDSDRWLLDAVRLHGKGELGDLPFLEWHDELSELAEGPWLGAKLAEEGPTRRRDAAARSALFHALEPRAALAEAFGDTVGLADFVQELNRLVGQTDYVSPAAEEGLRVVSSASAIGSAEVLCVLGMIEGAFPRRRSEDPILSDSERSGIDALRPSAPRLKNSHDEARAERDELVRLCAAAGRDILFFYPQVGDDRDNTPAFYLSEVERVAGAALDKIDLPPTRLTPEPGECLIEADAALADALQLPKNYPADPDLRTAQAREAIQGLPEDGLSARDLRYVLQCPFRYVFSRRLKLRASGDENVWWRLRHLPNRVGLAVAATPEAAREALDKGLAAELESLGPDVSESERQLLEAGGRREIDGFVEREFLARELWQKQGVDRSEGLRFGDAGTADELPIKGEKVRITGQFAALGELNGYAVGQVFGGRAYGMSVKSGSAGLEKIEDADLLELGVQMWSLCRRRGSVALEVDTTKGERLLMMLPKPEFDLESRIEKGLRVVDLGEKATFYERVKELLGTAVERIQAGEIAPTPGDHCGYCDFGELCRRAQGFSEGFDPFAPEEPSDG